MKIGLLTAILGDLSFEEVIEYAAQTGYQSLEVACWPKGGANRRYAGVTHIDVDNLTAEKVKTILDDCKRNNISISALSYYPNTMDENEEKRIFYQNHLCKVIEAAKKLGVDTVGTFVGRMQGRTIEENISLFEANWRPIIQKAESCGVRLAIENCPMLFTKDEWPGGQNMAISPDVWRKLFQIADSPYFGLNFDPSHFIWQQMDYIRPIYEFADKIFHVHIKDIKLDKEKLNDVGVLAMPLEYMRPKIPGHGDVKWDEFCSALYDINYQGSACVEIEDKAFEQGLADIKKAVKLSYHYMKNYII